MQENNEKQKRIVIWLPVSCSVHDQKKHCSLENNVKNRQCQLRQGELRTATPICHLPIAHKHSVHKMVKQEQIWAAAAREHFWRIHKWESQRGDVFLTDEENFSNNVQTRSWSLLPLKKRRDSHRPAFSIMGHRQGWSSGGKSSGVTTTSGHPWEKTLKKSPSPCISAAQMS